MISMLNPSLARQLLAIEEDDQKLNGLVSDMASHQLMFHAIAPVHGQPDAEMARLMARGFVVGQAVDGCFPQVGGEPHLAARVSHELAKCFQPVLITSTAFAAGEALIANVGAVGVSDMRGMLKAEDEVRIVTRAIYSVAIALSSAHWASRMMQPIAWPIVRWWSSGDPGFGLHTCGALLSPPTISGRAFTRSLRAMGPVTEIGRKVAWNASCSRANQADVRKTWRGIARLLETTTLQIAREDR